MKRIWIVLLLCGSAWAETASVLDQECMSDAHAAIKTNKQGQAEFIKSDAATVARVFAYGNCVGYIRGYMEGMNGTVVLMASGKAWFVQIDAPSIKEWDVAKALHLHLQSMPLDSGKGADVVLFDVLRQNGLIKGQEYIQQHAPVTQ